MSVLLAHESVIADVPLPRSWHGEGRPRWRDEPAPIGVSVVVEVSVDEEPVVASRTALHRLGDLALTLAAVLGLVVVGITATAHVTGLRPLVVKSGSMEPTIPTGSMVLIRTIPAADVQVGDVVAVERPDRTRVTHRVVEILPQGATTALTLKGDANDDVDPEPVVAQEAGEVVLSIPSIGRVSAFFASAKGGFVLGCIVTALGLPVLRRREQQP